MNLYQTKKNKRDETCVSQKISKRLWLGYREALTVNYLAEIKFNKTNL